MNPYKEVKERITHGEYDVDVLDSVVPGTFACCLTVPMMPMPLGTVYYRHVGNADKGGAVEIVDSFTSKEFRRIGIRTAIHDTMLEWWPDTAFFTGQGNEKSEAWLKKMGFKPHPVLGWYLRKGR